MMIMKLYYAIILVTTILFSISCQNNAVATKTPTNMQIGKIVYSLEVFQLENTSLLSPLQLELIRQSFPSERIVYFNGKQSCSQEITMDYGFRGLTTLLKDSSSQKYRYVKSFPYSDFWFKLEDELPSKTESSPPIVTFSDEKKDILGYSCKKAIVDESSVIYTIWYTTEIHIDDPTNAVIQKKAIPGVILEMDEKWTASNLSYYKKYTVKSIDLKHKSDPAIFDIPTGAIEVEDSGVASKRNRELFEKAMESDFEKRTIIGKWVLVYEDDSIELLIEQTPDLKKNSYILSETLILDGKRTKIPSVLAHFYGSKLLVEEPPNYVTYSLTDKGDLKLDQGDFFVYKKQQ